MNKQEIPLFLKELLNNQYEEKYFNEILRGYLEEREVTLRINTIKSSVKEIKDILKELKFEYVEVSWSDTALIIKNTSETELRKLDIYKEGKIYLQSLSSMLPPIILEPNENENILDMTSAPGGKTTQISALCKNKGMITACEKNKIRFERLKYNLEKQGVKCVNAMQEDARFLNEYFSFDKILLDAPCSGSGTINIFEKQFTRELIEKSVKIQTELLRKAIKILKKDGEIVYSTCSILEEENEGIIKKFLNQVKIVPIEFENFRDVPSLPTTISGTLCVLPTQKYEGFFVAKLKKI